MSKKSIICVMALSAWMSSAAWASGSANANITPSATITNNCLITGGSLSFGAYDPLGGAAVTATTTIGVQCTNGMTAPYVTLGQGLHAATGSTDAAPLRQLNNGSSGAINNLTYNLYTTSSYDSGPVWDNVTGVQSPTPSGSSQNMTVYGKITSGQSTAVAGTYNDTVVATVSF